MENRKIGTYFKLRKLVSIGFIFFAITLLSACSLNGKQVYQTNNIALQGFDPVAYFTQKKAVQGSSLYTYSNGQLVWHFTNEEHRQLFISNPVKYTPQYGGYCSYAMYYGLIVSSDPHAFTLLNDKLYLNYSLDVREKWLESTDKYIEQADAKWSKLIN
jgi:hypothetical protein